MAFLFSSEPTLNNNATPPQSKKKKPSFYYRSFKFFILKFCIALRRKLFNTSDHPQVANAMYSIGLQLSNLGQYQKALEAFQEVLGKRRVINRNSKLKVEGGKQAERIREEGREEGQKKGCRGHIF
jgi:tetratricopeptide (TPR) repeat protein